MGAFDRIRRGTDSSGRPLYATRAAWQHLDRVNAHVGGKLVIVQGAWSNAEASAGTHTYAGSMDIRTWNLTTAERNRAIRAARDPRIVGHAAAWYRHQGQGFDPHIHWVLMGDHPMHSAAANQIEMWKRGLNGLASGAADDFPYRPPTFTPYRYIEDDMFSEADSKRLERIEKALNTFRAKEYRRDLAAEEREKTRFNRTVTLLGKQADMLTVLINSTADDATKNELRRAKEEILTALKNDPDVRGVDNPSDDSMADNA